MTLNYLMVICPILLCKRSVNLYKLLITSFFTDVTRTKLPPQNVRTVGVFIINIVVVSAIVV